MPTQSTASGLKLHALCADVQGGSVAFEDGLAQLGHLLPDIDAEATAAATTSAACSSPGRIFHRGTRRATWAVCSPSSPARAVCFDHPLLSTLRGAALFTTATADVSLTRGRWMYEAVIGSDGLQQIGWCAAPGLFPFSSRLGVGDFPFTFSYDGHRQQLWNVAAQPSGIRWAAGDVVTCLLDLDAGVAHFLHNGVEAARCAVRPSGSGGARADPALAYSPGISLSMHETCTINLGGCGFRHPRPGFRGINDSRAEDAAWEARARLFWELMRDDSAFAIAASAALLSGLNGAEGADGVAPVLAVLLDEITALDGAGIGAVVRRLGLVLCDEAFAGLMRMLLAAVCWLPSTSLADAGDPRPSAHLHALVALLQSPHAVETWLSSSAFVTDFLNIFRVKAPNNADLERCVFPHSEGPITVDTLPEVLPHFAARTYALFEKAISIDDEHRVLVLQLLLAHSQRGHDKVQEAIDACITDFAERARAPQGPQQQQQRRPSALNITTSLAARLFFALAQVIVDDADSQTLAGPAALAARFLPPRVLRQMTVEGLVINRIGGSARTLQAMHPLPEVNDAGSEPPAPHNPLLVKACLLYALGVKDRVLTACNGLMLRQRMQQGLPVRGDSPALSDIIRLTFWDAATLFYSGRNPSLMRLSGLIVRIANHYFQRPEFFHMPIIMIECFVDILHFVRKTSPSYAATLRTVPHCVTFFIEKFLHARIANSETSEYMVLSLGAIMDSVEEHRRALVDVLRQHDEGSLMHFLMLVFSHFGHRLAWTLVVGILVRLNTGNGFNMIDLEEEQIDWGLIFPNRRRGDESFEAHRFFAALFRKYLVSGPWRENQDPDINGHPKVFFSNLITHTNWSLTELGAALADIKEMPDAALTQHELTKRRRCVSLFDLTRKLLHIVEFFIDAAFDIFFDDAARVEAAPGSGSRSSNGADKSDIGDRVLNADMAVEVLTQCLTRFSSPDASNQLNRVAALRQSGTERIMPWKLLAPIVGILHSMLRGGANLSLTSNPFLVAVAKPGIEWSLESIAHAFGSVDWDTTGVGSNVRKSDFTRDSQVMNALREAHAANVRGAKLDDDDSGLVEDGVCSICAFQRINITFVPCGHQSCGTCIRRHLLTNSKCFFCSKHIDDLTELADIGVAGSNPVV